MDADALRKIKRKIILIFPLSLVVLAAMFFLPAGTFLYWQAWVVIIEILGVASFVTAYFLKRSPEFLERRMQFKEKEVKQKRIIQIANVLCFFGFLIPGLDHRFGWSAVPVWLVLAADAVFLAGYILIFFAFKENAFAGRTVEVFEGQKVIDTGPYAVVRHPMYAGIIPLFVSMPVALGSFWALLPMIPVCFIIILRALNEEEVLRRDLPGYNAYCEKVRYRLVPYVW